LGAERASNTMVLLRSILSLNRRSSVHVAFTDGLTKRWLLAEGTPVSNDYDKLWQDHFEKLEAHVEIMKRKHPERVDIPYPSDYFLRNWLSKQRHLYQLKIKDETNALTDDRQEQLEKLGIFLEPLVAKWEIRYNQLAEFIEKNGCFPYDLEVEDLGKEDKLLYYWCQKQKAKREEMTPEREAKLNQIGFVFYAHEANWMKRLAELEEYLRTYGDCMVPRDGAHHSLAVWVGIQRYEYKLFREGRARSSMSAERIEMLSKLGFVWNVLDERWLEKFQDLEEDVRLNGPGFIPSRKDNRSLRTWIEHQRKLYRLKLAGEQGSLTAEREAMLNKLEFPWNEHQ
jgi:hypothetical protein